MGQIAVTIHGHSYPIACDDGQEEHVTRLAAYIDQRANEIAQSVGTVGESRLLVMASLLVADELADVYNEVDRLQEKAKVAEMTVRERTRQDVEGTFAPIVEKLAERVEDIAAKLETN